MTKMWNQGVVLGKFMPLHLGHEYLIRTGITQSEHLAIVVCTLQREPIPGELRYEWIKQRFAEEIQDGKVTVFHLREDWMPQNPEDCYDSSVFFGTWAGVLQAYVKKSIDVLFTSEHYGETVSKFLHCEHFMVDLERKMVPISGTQIREHPRKHLRFLNPTVASYFTEEGGL